MKVQITATITTRVNKTVEMSSETYQKWCDGHDINDSILAGYTDISDRVDDLDPDVELWPVKEKSDV